jgi:hypothetical protein
LSRPVAEPGRLLQELLRDGFDFLAISGLQLREAASQLVGVGVDPRRVAVIERGAEPGFGGLGIGDPH